MFKFLDLEPESFGLDISDLSLKIVRLKKRGRFFKLSSWGETNIRKGMIEQGEIKYEDALAKEIKNAVAKVKGAKLGTKNVIASLPEKKGFLQVIKMPKMDEDDLKTAVPFEAENYIPLPLEKSYLDYQLIDSNGSNYINVLVAAMDKSIIDPYFSCFKKAGLVLRALEIESLAVARSLIKNEFSDFSVLIIDFGKSTTSFIIYYNSSIVFTSSIPACSGELTAAIASSLNLDLKEAEKLKIRYGLTSRNKKEGKKTAAAMGPVLKTLLKNIKKYIDYYDEHNKGKKIKKILLCGRGSNLAGLPDLLFSELKITAEIANPWINILPPDPKEIPELVFKESVGYATALGLALRGIKK